MRVQIRNKSLKAENIPLLEGAYNVALSISLPQGQLPIEADVQQVEKRKEIEASKKE